MSRHIPVEMRWFIRRDLADALRIERTWTEEDWLRHMRQQTGIAMVAELETEASPVVAVMAYTLHARSVELLTLAVDPAFRRAGIGRQMVAKLESKLSPHRRTRIWMAVSDRLTDAHLFFRGCHFRATRVIRHSEGADYRFELALPRCELADDEDKEFRTADLFDDADPQG